MGVLFGSKKKDKPKTNISSLNQTEQTIIQCKQCRDKIKAYIKKMDKIAGVKKEKAKELLIAKDKDRAKIYLRQSKMHTTQSQSSMKQLEMIEDQIASIETAVQLSEVTSVLQKGNAVLKKLQQEVNVEKWEKIADDLAESKEHQEEISNFFKQQGINEEDYEESVNKDYDKLLNELGLNSEAAVDLNLPNAPTDEIIVNKEDEKIKTAIAN